MAKTKKKSRKKNNKKRRGTILIMLFLTLFVGIGAYLLTSPSFAIQQIFIKGNEQLSQGQIQKIAEIKIGDNIFSKLGIVTKVRLKESGYIEDAQIRKVYPNTIEIEVKERKKQFQIQTETGYYIYIDEQGYIIDCLKDKLQIPTIIGMDITEKEIEGKNRIDEKNLNTMEKILQIREECRKIEIADKITQIQVNGEYILSLENDGLVINLGDTTDLKNRMYYVSAIMKQEVGNRGTIYVNGNFNEGFTAYFSAN